MFDQKDIIRFNNTGSILFLLFVSLGLLIYSNSKNNLAERNISSLTTEASFNNNLAVFFPGTVFKFFKKTFVQIKCDFKVLSFNNNLFLENRKTDIKISLLQDIQQTIDRIPVLIFYHHPFPVGNDDFPDLS
jgi:hypothetical protein